MKKQYFVLLSSLVLALFLTSCDGKSKVDCTKDPKAKGCPNYENNITPSDNKNLDVNDINNDDMTNKTDNHSLHNDK